MTPIKFDISSLSLGRAFALEVKASGSGEIEGLASPFGGSPDSYGDIIEPGAFSASLAKHKAAGTAPALLWAHDQSRPVGRWSQMQERADGLHVSGQLNLKTEAGQQAYEHVKGGDLDGLSIGFGIAPGGASVDRQGVRTLKALDLYEVSIVTLPAALSARVQQVKSITGPDELRDLLRGHGLPVRFCEKVAAGGWAHLQNATPQQLETEAKAQAEADTMAAILRELRRYA
ncbi:HK97 family phage prohead protease [Maricaulis sp.]|uniref:HK97 family phage prohead protease n=1 Tax=Maricaulis sp. TaxID=1486257 RepID=UPI003A91ED03